MKKSLCSVISILLVIVMTAGMCLTAMADDKESVFDSYVSLGDSISCGYTEDYYTKNDELWDVVSEYAPCRIVASELGVRETCDGGFSGCRSVDLFLLLGGECDLDAYNSGNGYYTAKLEKMMTTRAAEIREKVRTADLVTVTVGANDIIGYAFRILQGESADGKVTVTGETVSRFVELMWEGYGNLCRDYPALLTRIRELSENENMELVITGIFDPFRDATLTDSTLLPVGTALSTITSLLNEQYRGWAEDYNALYADISDCDSWFNGYPGETTSILGALDKVALYVHPTVDGYAYIGRQIVKAIQDKHAAVTTDIRLDLQSVKAKSVTSVLVNGVAVKSFKVTGTYSIEIPCSNKLAATVTVIAREGRTVKTTVWYVRWIPGTGYQPTAIAKNGDVAQSGISAAQKVAGNVTSVVKSITSLFKR